MAKPKPRIRKRRVLDRLRDAQNSSSSIIAAADSQAQSDSKTIELIPVSKSDREARKAALREEIRASTPQTKVNRKKSARLEKYIEGKLKKEENADIMKKLEGMRVNLEGMMSVGELGKGRKAVSAGSGYVNMEAETESEDDLQENHSASKTVGNGENRVKTQHMSQPAFGGGLKRPLEVDEDGRPILNKRVKTKGKGFPKKALLFQEPSPMSEQSEEESEADESEESEWEGFESDTVLMPNVTKGPEKKGHISDDEEDDNTSEVDDVESDESEEDSEEQSSEEEIEPVSEEAKSQLKARTSAFKAWAEKQRNDTLGFTPSNQLSEEIIKPKAEHIPRPLEMDLLPAELTLNGTNLERTAHAVQVIRTEEIQDSRLKLPVVEKEQQIMEAIFNHDVVIISGATGSGKTTQVPQFLFENGFGDRSGPTPGMIGVTQPRRIAAVSMAKRVSEELCDKENVVAHQIRFDTTVGVKTAIKFMTDGVLLRELSEDFSLKKYSAIVIDEAHERTLNTDVLISLVSRCVKARSELAKEKRGSYYSLKLVIMSATLRVSDFRQNPRLFHQPPPLVEAEGRQFEVMVHWARKTTHDFLDAAFKKISRGHKQLPPGGILVFLPGQSDIRYVERRLKESFKATTATVDYPSVRVSADHMPIEDEDLDTLDIHQDERLRDHIRNVEDNESDSEVDIEGLDEEENEFNIENEEKPLELLKAHILPLYSQLPQKEQLKVFQPPPEGSRVIVLATNVAETSLTIPGIRYIFDSGRVKERQWDHVGVQTFNTTWVSKASADQRMGRAGRTGPGHCYRLYSSAIYESFEDHTKPEIYRSPLEGVVLQLKTLNIGRVDRFPFPTPPEETSLLKAEFLLKHLGALNSVGKITPLGKELYNYPVGPRFAQMLRLGRLYGCFELVIAAVAALDVPEIFVSESFLHHHESGPSQDSDSEIELLNGQREAQESGLQEATRKAFNSSQGKLAKLCPFSDVIKLLSGVVAYSNAEDNELWCAQNFARSKALKDINLLREQLTGIVRNLHPGSIGKFSVKLSMPTEKQVSTIRQIVAAGFIDQVAIRADLSPTPPPVLRKPKRAIDVRYQTLFLSWDGSEIGSEDEKFVYVHPSSVLAHRSPTKMPPFIVYRSLQRSQHAREDKAPKTRMHPLTSVSGPQLAVLARGTTLLQVSKPRNRVTVLPSGADGKERRRCMVDLSLIGRDSDLGWFLAQKEVVQKRTAKEGWVVEEYF